MTTAATGPRLRARVADVPDFAPMLPYGIATAIIGTIVWLARERALTHAMAIVTASWMMWAGVIMMTSALTTLGYLPHHHYPWYAGIGIDAFAVWSLSRDPTNRIKATVSAVFCVQIAMHMAYGVRTLMYGSADGELYAINLKFTGWIELLLLGGWSVGSAGDRLLHRVRRVVPTPRRTSNSRHLGDKG